MNRIRKLAAASAIAVAAASTSASALTIDFNNVNNISTSSNAYIGFRAAADFWESVITTDATLLFNIGFADLGNPNIIGSTGSTRFTGFSMNEVYGAMAATGNSALDSTAAAHMSPLTQAAAWYDATATDGYVSAITQKAKANGQGVVQNTRTTNTSNPAPAGGTAAIGLNGVEVTSNREWDADKSRNNGDLLVNTSIMKALGGFGLTDRDYSCTNRVNAAACNADPTRVAGGRGIDAKITFNSTFNFDYNPINGIGAGQIDFIGTAIHEMGHALGFVSGVDLYDTNTNLAANLDTLQGLMSTLDLFRYSDDVTNIAPGTGQVLDWSVGNSATNADNLRGRAYFSFDGATKGLSAFGGDAGYFSTGQTFGDGRQASHWMDTPYRALPGNTATTQCITPIRPSRGVMDPTAGGCEESIITSLDIAAFDAMGWNVKYNVLSDSGVTRSFTSAQALRGLGLVPEPSQWALLIGGFGLVGGVMRRRKSVAISA